MAHFAAATRLIFSGDGNLDVLIPEWTNARDNSGGLITAMECTAVEAPPPPAAASIVGTAYDLTPDGTSFDKLVTITCKYQPSQVPEGVAEAELAVSCYQEDSGDWTSLVSIVDPETNTIKAFANHTSVFAVVAPIPPPPPPPPPTPAAFSTGMLTVTPAEVEIGEPVEISVRLTNTGEEAGSYPLALEVNGSAAETKEVTLTGGDSKTVVFTTVIGEAGDYPVVVDGLAGSFTVKRSPYSLPFGWNVMAPIIAGIFLAIFLPLRLRKKKVDA